MLGFLGLAEKLRVAKFGGLSKLTNGVLMVDDQAAPMVDSQNKAGACSPAECLTQSRRSSCLLARRSLLCGRTGTCWHSAPYVRAAAWAALPKCATRRTVEHLGPLTRSHWRGDAVRLSSWAAARASRNRHAAPTGVGRGCEHGSRRRALLTAQGAVRQVRPMTFTMGAQ